MDWQQQTTLSLGHTHNLRLNELQQQTQRQDVRHFSTQQEEGELVSIHDHLDELHTIPLADVRNFCIIAHVVSTMYIAENYLFKSLLRRCFSQLLTCPLIFHPNKIYFFDP